MRKKPIAIGVLLVLSLSLTACANMDAPKRNWQMVSAADLQINPASSETSPIAENFWQSLHDEQLNQLFEQAFLTAPNLQLALARVDEAGAQYQQAQSLLGPNVDLNGGFSRQRLSGNTAQGQMQEQRKGTLYANESTVNLGFAWDVDLWGKYRNEVKAAMGATLAQELEWQQSKLILMGSVFNHYNQWQLLTAQISLVDERIAIQNRILALENQQIKAGIAAPANRYQTELLVNQLQADKSQLDVQKIAHEQALAALIGQPVSRLSLSAQGFVGKVPSLPVDDLNSGLLSFRPDIAAQKALLMAKTAQVDVAKAQFYPQVRIQALAGFSAIDIADLIKPSSKVLGLLPAVTLPIFHSGQLRANLAQHRAQYDAQIAMYNQTVFNAVRDAATSFGQYQALQNTLNRQQQAMAIQAKNVGSQKKRQQAGLGNALPVLYGQDQLLALKMQALQSEASWRQSWMNVNLQFGGGLKVAAGNVSN